MRLHLSPALAGEIVVVENTEPGRPVAWRHRLQAEYGHLADRVRFVPAGALGPMPRASGWWTQQALKLLACRTAACPRCVILDAKNHLVRPLRRDFLQGRDGRMLARRYDYRRHPLRCFLERTLAFCGLPVEPHVGWFMQAATPFAGDRADVADATRHVEDRTGRRFAIGLVEARITEFFLLAACLMRRGVLEERYDHSQLACPVVWNAGAGSATLLAAIREAEEHGAPVFAVHRRVIPQLDDAARVALGRFWVRCGLFNSVDEAVVELVGG